MEIARYILIGLYFIVCVALIITTVLQTKDTRNSIEDVAENPRANKYFDKNKSRTKSGKMQKNTIVLGIIFAILTIVLGIIYML